MGSFFDVFFFVILVLIATLAFADFLLGKEGQKKVKERVGNWWIFLDDSTYAGLSATDASNLYSWFLKCLGPITSLRFWLSACVGASVLLAITLFVLFSLWTGSFIENAIDSFFLVFEVLDDRGLNIFLANVIFPVICFVITLGFLRLLASTNSLLLLLLLTVCNVITVSVVSLLSIIIVQHHRTWDPFDFGNLFDQFIWLSGGITALLPILLHVFFASFLIVSKLLTPLLKRPVNLILLRLHESEKGTLSLVGIALGTLAKLMQEGLKLL